MTAPQQYRKKPVEIAALPWTGYNVEDVKAFVGSALHVFRSDNPFTPSGIPELQIATLEGRMECPVGSWVIRGVAGEFYACRADIFERTYDPVSSTCHPPLS